VLCRRSTSNHSDTDVFANSVKAEPVGKIDGHSLCLSLSSYYCCVTAETFTCPDANALLVNVVPICYCTNQFMWVVFDRPVSVGGYSRPLFGTHCH